MDYFDIVKMLFWFMAVFAAAGWVACGLTEEKLKEAKQEILSLKKEILSLKKENAQLSKQVAFLEIEKATDLSKK